MRVLSIDPGYGRCGVAVLESGRAVKLQYSACIETDAKLAFGERLRTVGNEIVRLIEEFNVDALAIEELYFSGNQKTALRVAEVRGMIVYLAAANGLPLIEYNPLSVKVAVTGYGRASKEQVIKMVRQLVETPKKRMLDDEYDAIAVGITALAENSSKNKHILA
jgi:crossover junction endodeoxyribonuclease RuvC